MHASRFSLIALAALAACSNPYRAQPEPVSPTPSSAGSAAPTATPANPAPTPPASSPAPAVSAAPAATPAAAAAPSAQAAVDLSGEWTWELMDAQGRTVPGAMTITRSGATWGGSVTPQGSETAPIRSVAISGEKVTMHVDTPEGDALLELTLAADRRSMAGQLTYNGQNAAFTATRR